MNSTRSLTSGLIALGATMLALAHGALAEEPRDACVRPEASLLLPLEGSWSVRWTNRTATGKYETVEGAAEIAREPAGCVLTERFGTRWQGKPYQSLRLINFSLPSEVESLALDSEHGRFLRFSGAASNGVLTLTWASDNGGRMQVRFEMRVTNHDLFETTTDLSTDHGSSWSKVQAGHYRRAKARS